ncbi:hypothetical protein FZZ93_11305 [Halomonas eurihalina]|uniref:Uncharacterized protein n=1 Tax=Halomonas eurihalina TaxID=42566 RepID=A0A5D9D4Z1_HALER|nr:hypothetical protein [Halomonas eurihalina]MDR5858737.1 hypothetical protein [Halomonas eurihalina]TZG38876.1 hypothetical protein FZZ93_11305 [Halomonas eurihalina]
MIEWVSQHSSFLQVVTSVATLLVWIFYAQMLMAGYIRQRRPKVVINQVMGLSMKGRCLISNMSAEHIHIESAHARLHSHEGVRCCTVSEMEREEDETTPASLQGGTLQGPLSSGGYIDAGEIQHLVNRARQAPIEDSSTLCRDGDAPDVLELLVLYIYSSAPGIMGASRQFVFDDDGQATPAHLETRQHRNWLDRRRMSTLYRAYLDR